MAEIHVQAKKKNTPVWIWIVIGLVVLGVIAYIFLRNKKADEGSAGNKPNPTSYIRESYTRDIKAVPFYG